MNAWTIHPGHGLASLAPGEREPQALGPRDVRMRVGAAALNYRDLMVARGLYGVLPDRPVVPLSDGAGVVAEVGAEVTRVKAGDRVLTTYFPRWADGRGSPEAAGASFGAQLEGVLAEEFVAGEEGFVLAPRDVSDAEAATITCAGATAWNALFVRASLRPGATVLILGTGGVSVWALQIAARAGFRTIVTSSSDDKLARAEALGAGGLVNYRRTPEWQDEVLRMTDGRGADLVIEVGGQDTLLRSVQAVAWDGTVVAIGGLSGFGGQALAPGHLVGTEKRVVGMSVGSRASTEDLVRFMDVTGLKPVVDQAFAFGEARAAYDQLEAGGAFGKLVVTTG